MGWLAGLTYCLMGGNLLNLLNNLRLLHLHRPASFQIFFTMHVFGFHLFNLLFGTTLIGSTVQRWLTTAPGAPTTHWYQLRCVLAQPIYVMAGQEITGQLRMVAHNAQSYTLYLTLMGLFLSSLLFLYC